MRTPPNPPLLLLLLLLLLPLAAARPRRQAKQEEEAAAPAIINIGDMFKKLVTPDKELLGGFNSVVDRMDRLDSGHGTCGQKRVCEMFSENVIERSDGLAVDKGIMRHVIDGSLDFVFQAFMPVFDFMGLGPVARKEIYLSDYLIDSIDQLIVSVTRFLAGRSASRQLEETGLLRAAVAAIPTPVRVGYYGG